MSGAGPSGGLGARLRRGRGALAALALAGAALAAFGPAALSGAPLPLALLAAALPLAFWLGRDALLRARLAETPGPGLVAVREGRVGYLGPEAGGIADLDALISVEIVQRPGGPVWVLRPAGAPAVAIPAAAEGAEGLLDTLAALPGFAPGAVAAALDAPLGAHVILWRRRGPLPVAT
jgi:hypothetical protein